MAKKIVIPTCVDCPYKGYKFDHEKAIPFPVPMCKKTNKGLGYFEERVGIHLKITYDRIIPTWCPLEEN